MYTTLKQYDTIDMVYRYGFIGDYKMKKYLIPKQIILSFQGLPCFPERQYINIDVKWNPTQFQSA